MLRHTHPLVKIRESVNPLIAVYKTSRFIVSLVFTGALIFCPIWQRLLLFLFTSCQTFCPVTRRTIFLFFFSFKSQLFLLLRGFEKKAMATLDDKLLGEKLHYYCSSSSESEPEDEDGEKSDQPASLDPTTTTRQWDGTSCNVLMQTHSDVLLFFFFTVFFLTCQQTGPKGVIKDYQRFKQLERERREEQKEELQVLAKKFSLTCRTNVTFSHNNFVCRNLIKSEIFFCRLKTTRPSLKRRSWKKSWPNSWMNRASSNLSSRGCRYTHSPICSRLIKQFADCNRKC